MSFPWLMTVILLILSPVTWAVTITHLTGGHGDIWTDYLTERASVFKKQTGADIEILAMGGNQAREQLAVMQAAGIPPDVTDFWGALAGDYIAMGFFEDLRPYAAKAGYQLERLYQPQVLEALTYKGALFSMPNYINPRVTYFHVDLFADAGLPNPIAMGDAWVWEAMREAAKRLTRDFNGDGNPDQFGIDTVTSMAWEQFILQAGGRMYNEILFPTQSLFNSEPVLVATEFARQLRVDDRVAGGNLANRTAAMSLTASAQIKAQLNAAGHDWDMVLHAKGPFSRASIFGVGGLQLVASGKNKEWAWKWIEFLTLDAESVRAYIKTNQRIPPLVTLQREFGHLVPDLSPNWLALVHSVGQENSSTLSVVTKNTASITSAINSNINQVWSGQTPARVALTQIHELVTALLRD